MTRYGILYRTAVLLAVVLLGIGLLKHWASVGEMRNWALFTIALILALVAVSDGWAVRD